ncbi:hypothetical protein B0H13DRAFT_2299943 [Mycena leptocephala]|nr:hypothetical protein B0H13DRAFT_2299943 [Mycena leptocephala]
MSPSATLYPVFADACRRGAPPHLLLSAALTVSTLAVPTTSWFDTETAHGNSGRGLHLLHQEERASWPPKLKRQSFCTSPWASSLPLVHHDQHWRRVDQLICKWMATASQVRHPLPPAAPGLRSRLSSSYMRCRWHTVPKSRRYLRLNTGGRCSTHTREEAAPAFRSIRVHAGADSRTSAPDSRLRRRRTDYVPAVPVPTATTDCNYHCACEHLDCVALRFLLSPHLILSLSLALSFPHSSLSRSRLLSVVPGCSLSHLNPSIPPITQSLLRFLSSLPHPSPSPVPFSTHSVSP